ncbi:hypothetical protein LTR70_001897 [Exophiala xenobiotica]|uniref:Uncharacterized protein n=1 Tax=Lithohypha guttulata TaxID=1690604 RepID=A0ABR0K9Y5_9EURO|nr:hypothetical protein LTR24_005101 [Lithohypha guttulata]KAK5326882.1 hypothetical protein LTR70_001897 [Exophiala xenobiotica]
MPLFKKNGKKDLENKRLPPEVGEKEGNTTSADRNEKIVANVGSGFRDDKIALNSEEGFEIPASGKGTLLPTYRSEVATRVTNFDTVLSSTGSSSEVAPDFHPVTSQALVPYDGKEVVLPNKSANVPSISTSIQASQLYREYSFYYTNALKHLIICDPDQQVLYFAEISPFAKGTPDVQIRDIAGGGFDNLARMGPNLGMKEARDAPVVAVADSMPSSKYIKLGLGDPLQPETNTWLLMRNVHDDPKNNSERYDMTVAKLGKQQTYQWISGVAADTNSANLPDMGKSRRNSHSKEVFRMLSDDGVVAAFRTTGLATVKKRGALRVYEPPGLDDLLLIFTSCSALCGKQRRRRMKKGLLMGMWPGDK